MKEKRDFERIETPFCVECSTPRSNNKSIGIIRDISLEGVRVTTDSSLRTSPGKISVLTMLLPETILEISGEVVWVRKTKGRKEFGVKITQSSSLFKDYVQDYIG